MLPSFAGLAMADIIKNYFVSPTLLRVVRVFRVGRVLRLVKSAKGIRTLLFSLAVSMPALFNIGLLLFLVMFIYAVFGMSFFMHVKKYAGIDDMFNFETFGQSMILLFQISTSAGWDGVLAGITNDKDCNSSAANKGPHGDCGSSGLGVMYLVSYLVISFLVIINMYIAVILENFSQATEDVQQGLTQDDFDMYYEIWEKFDETACQYIPLERLCEFVEALEEPLHLPHDSFFKLVSMQIPICEGDRVHCVDILDALTKNFLGTEGDPGELSEISKKPERKNYVVISNTLKRQRENFCARIIQQIWREFVRKKKAGLLKDFPSAPKQLAEDQPWPATQSFPKETIITIENPEGEGVEVKDQGQSHKESKPSEQVVEMEQIQEEAEENSSKTEEDGEDLHTVNKEQQGKKEEEERPFSPEVDSKTVELFPESSAVV